MNLAALRKQGNWSMRALAEQAQVTRRMLQILEKGRTNTALVTVDRLARALGVSTGSLLGPRPVARQDADSPIEVVLSQNLVSARKRLALTQEMLSERSGVGRDLIGHIERQSQNPSIETLVKLAAALGLTLEALLTSN
ncbi:helix-turn-helix transcriptional regulator [uncultured Hydrogenophaga sp.]|uniref:helix-turn-helix domain-containing protein n=1 Tax=uncultured Hydrogenophaga sp. TaxID=199683 RepID=UPI0025831167|nr:helix-turn-helix transcriptional regulator [uncultured Hydrogenophaga sp.]